MIKRSVSLAVRSAAHAGSVLLVQRPDDDEDLPGVWGLPAATLAPHESWHEAAVRAGRDKLGVDLRVDGELERGALERSRYTLEMRLYAATLLGGEPAVRQPVRGVTQYQAWRWGQPGELQQAAALGSLCSQLYLRSIGE